jgi:hypothetical protein
MSNLLQMSTARSGPESTEVNPGVPTITPAAGPEFKPLNKLQIARGYQQAFFLLRDLAATKAHLLSKDGWERLVRATEYVGIRYNEVVLAGTEFEPKPWKSRPE